MRWIKKVSTAIKKTLRSWLQIDATSPTMIQINEAVDYEVNAIRNRIWYRGDSNELQQLYGHINEDADKYKFWACNSTPGLDIRKIHTGLPNLIVKTLASIVMADMNDIEIEDAIKKEEWKKIEDDNQFRKNLSKDLKEILFIGDGAYKISFDPEISEQPIIEFYPGERVEFVRKRGRIRELIYKTPYIQGKQRYTLHEHYGYGYIIYKLYKDPEGQEVDISAVDELRGLEDVEFDDNIMLGLPVQIFESSKWEGRGQSIFDGKIDSFDSFDEAWSQWVDALRSGRAKTYIPESLIPRDAEKGHLLKPNAFDNKFIATETDNSEGAQNKVSVEQPEIPHDSYLATYVTALDLCLQGIISPSTLGIDVKKLDNAEAQREKEKATLYTRNAIVEALQEMLPKLINIAINAKRILEKKTLEDVDATIPFGEYANPSFESQVETVGKARQYGIMSVEASVEELYGDSKEKTWKKEEVSRLKEEQGLLEMDTPSAAGEDMELLDGE